MQLYVVVDTLGDGRIIGVFADREVACEIVAVDPNYYKLHECVLGEISERSIRWARSDEQRARLSDLATRDS